MLLFSQNLLAESQDVKKQGDQGNKDENTKVFFGNHLLSIEDSDSALEISVGNGGLNILQSLEGPKCNFERYTANDEWDQ